LYSEFGVQNDAWSPEKEARNENHGRSNYWREPSLASVPI